MPTRPDPTLPRFAPANQGWGWMFVYGLVSVIVGVAALWWPFPATLAASVVIGAFLFAAGIASLISAFTARAHEGRWYALAVGILAIALGILLAARPVAGAFSLTLVIAVWLLVRGALELYWGYRFTRNRGLMIVLGVVNIVLAVLILSTVPMSALTLPGFVLGISFLASGLTAIVHAIGHRQTV